MTHIPPRQMFAFLDELSKQAGYGTTLGLGALGGAGLNMLRHRGEEGQVGNAVKGALVGAAGTGAGLLATKGGRDAALNVLKRERYHLTGQGLGSNPRDRMIAAKKIGLIRPKGMTPEQYAQSASDLEKGYQSAPGVVHNLMSRPGEVLKRGWERGGRFGQVMTGMGALQAARGFAQTPEEGGPGRLEKGLTGVGQMVGGLVSPPGLVAGSLMSGGLSSIGKRVGRLGDKALGHGRVVPQQEAADYGYPVGANV